MWHIIGSLIILLITGSELYAFKPLHITIEKKIEGHTLVIELESMEFIPANHDISRIHQNIIDGKKSYGMLAKVPRTQLSKFIVHIDEKTISIDPELYQHFYNPNLYYDEINYGRHVDAFFGNTFDTIFVFMQGGDAAGAYSVVWIVDKNGDVNYCVPPIYEMTWLFDW